MAVVKKPKVEKIAREIPKQEFNEQEERYKIWGDVEYFSEKYCKVWYKQKSVFVPFKLLPTQRRVIKAYENNDKNIVIKYRQGGISTVTEMYLAHLIISTPDLKIAIVANSLKLAKKFLRETDDFVRNLPSWVGIQTVKNASEYKIYNNKTEMMALAASKDGVRGFTPDILVIDEAAYLEKGVDFWTSARGSMSAGGRIFMISTPNSHDPVYYMTYDGALNKQNDFNIVEIRWWEDSRFNQDLRFKLHEEIIDDIWLTNKNGDKNLDLVKCFELIKKGYNPTSTWYENECAGYGYSPRRIAQELNNAFIGSGGNLIDEDSISYQDKHNVQIPIRCEFRDKNFWIWEDPKPDGKYVIGVDGSSGNAEDYSGIQIIDIETGNQVAEYQGRLKPEELGDLVFEYTMRYNQAFVVMDVTGGSGAIPMLILLDKGYKNIYHTENSNRAVKEKLEKYLDNDGRIPGFVISTNRPIILREFERVVRLNEFKIRSTRLMSEIKTFVWIGDEKGRYDHPRSGHDDLLFGSTIAFAGLGKLNQNKMDAENAKKMASLWGIGLTEPNRTPTPTNTREIGQRQPLSPTLGQQHNTYSSPFDKNRYSSEIEKYMYLMFKKL